jgi:K+-transporting ATPase KdpF subunit
MWFSASACVEENMSSGAIIMLVICAGLLAYLVYAMLRPEKF